MPPGVLLLMLVVVPVLIAFFLGLFSFKGLTPLVFRCLRCDHRFRRAPHRPFPESCPSCGSPEWNRSAE